MESALDGADVFFGSLLFDFDQVQWLRTKVEQIPTRFVFESALELMSTTSVGSFEMKPAPDGQKAGPPPAVKAISASLAAARRKISSWAISASSRLALRCCASSRAGRQGPAQLADSIWVLEPGRP